MCVSPEWSMWIIHEISIRFWPFRFTFVGIFKFLDRVQHIVPRESEAYTLLADSWNSNFGATVLYLRLLYLQLTTITTTIILLRPTTCLLSIKISVTVTFWWRAITVRLYWYIICRRRRPSSVTDRERTMNRQIIWEYYNL